MSESRGPSNPSPPMTEEDVLAHLTEYTADVDELEKKLEEIETEVKDLSDKMDAASATLEPPPPQLSEAEWAKLAGNVPLHNEESDSDNEDKDEDEENLESADVSSVDLGLVPPVSPPVLKAATVPLRLEDYKSEASKWTNEVSVILAAEGTWPFKKDFLTIQVPSEGQSFHRVSTIMGIFKFEFGEELREESGQIRFKIQADETRKNLVMELWGKDIIDKRLPAQPLPVRDKRLVREIHSSKAKSGGKFIEFTKILKEIGDQKSTKRSPLKEPILHAIKEALTLWLEIKKINDKYRDLLKKDKKARQNLGKAKNLLLMAEVLFEKQPENITQERLATINLQLKTADAQLNYFNEQREAIRKAQVQADVEYKQKQEEARLALSSSGPSPVASASVVEPLVKSEPEARIESEQKLVFTAESKASVTPSPLPVARVEWGAGVSSEEPASLVISLLKNAEARPLAIEVTHAELTKGLGGGFAFKFEDDKITLTRIVGGKFASILAYEHLLPGVSEGLRQLQRQAVIEKAKTWEKVTASLTKERDDYSLTIRVPCRDSSDVKLKELLLKKLVGGDVQKGSDFIELKVKLGKKGEYPAKLEELAEIWGPNITVTTPLTVKSLSWGEPSAVGKKMVLELQAPVESVLALAGTMRSLELSGKFKFNPIGNPATKIEISSVSDENFKQEDLSELSRLNTQLLSISAKQMQAFSEKYAKDTIKAEIGKLKAEVEIKKVEEGSRLFNIGGNQYLIIGVPKGKGAQEQQRKQQLCEIFGLKEDQLKSTLGGIQFKIKLRANEALVKELWGADKIPQQITKAASVQTRQVAASTKTLISDDASILSLRDRRRRNLKIVTKPSEPATILNGPPVTPVISTAASGASSGASSSPSGFSAASSGVSITPTAVPFVSLSTSLPPPAASATSSAVPVTPIATPPTFAPVPPPFPFSLPADNEDEPSPPPPPPAEDEDDLSPPPSPPPLRSPTPRSSVLKHGQAFSIDVEISQSPRHSITSRASLVAPSEVKPNQWHKVSGLWAMPCQILLGQQPTVVNNAIAAFRAAASAANLESLVKSALSPEPSRFVQFRKGEVRLSPYVPMHIDNSAGANSPQNFIKQCGVIATCIQPGKRLDWDFVLPQEAQQKMQAKTDDPYYKIFLMEYVHQIVQDLIRSLRESGAKSAPIIHLNKKGGAENTDYSAEELAMLQYCHFKKINCVDKNGAELNKEEILKTHGLAVEENDSFTKDFRNCLDSAQPSYRESSESEAEDENEDEDSPSEDKEDNDNDNDNDEDEDENEDENEDESEDENEDEDKDEDEDENYRGPSF